jgi:hypothetical protein
MLVRGAQLAHSTTNLFPDDVFVQIDIDIVQVAVHLVPITANNTTTVAESATLAVVSRSTRSLFVVFIVHILFFFVTITANAASSFVFVWDVV